MPSRWAGVSLAECDIVVVILWLRLGSPIEVESYAKPEDNGYQTGTEWEYEDARQAAKAQGKPRILFYRRTKNQPLNGIYRQRVYPRKLEQFEKVNTFCEVCHDRDGSFLTPMTSRAILRESSSSICARSFINYQVCSRLCSVPPALICEYPPPST